MSTTRQSPPSSRTTHIAKSRTSDVLPEIDHPDVGTVISSEWTVHTPERQRRTVETLVDVWTEPGWPEGLYTYGFYLGTDGSTILHYSQWRDDQAYLDFFQSGRGGRVDRIDAAVPDIERHDLAHYRLHRSLAPADDQPGIIVTEFIPAAGPEDAQHRADELADAREHARPSGLVLAGVHVSSDGSRILDYTGWTTEEAFEAHLSSRSGTEPRRIKRFRPYRSLGRR